MENFIKFLLGSTCLLAPISFILLFALIYLLGMGYIKVPGIGRTQNQTNKIWTTLPDLARRTGDGFSLILCIIGTFFGLIGFLLPWLKLNSDPLFQYTNQHNFGGTLNGIAMVFQFMVTGISLIASNYQNSGVIAFILIALSVLVSIIPVLLFVSGGIGLGMISVPLGFLKLNMRKMGTFLIIAIIFNFCLSCSFLGFIQATSGGFEYISNAGFVSSQFFLNGEIAYGFWITTGGLFISLIGAIFSNTLGKTLSKLAINLSALDIENPSQDKDPYYKD